MAQLPFNSHFLQEWQENISEMILMNLLKNVLPKIHCARYMFIHRMQYNEMCITSKFYSGDAQGLLNLFTAGNVCFILLLLRFTRPTDLKQTVIEISML